MSVHSSLDGKVMRCGKVADGWTDYALDTWIDVTCPACLAAGYNEGLDNMIKAVAADNLEQVKKQCILCTDIMLARIERGDSTRINSTRDKRVQKRFCRRSKVKSH
jgi:hypothetical protein